MKAAFATNDRKTLAERTGRAKEFVIYELSENKIINTEYFENKHEHHEHEDEHKHSHKEITDILKDTDILYITKVGKHMKRDLEQAGIKYIKTDKKDISEILKNINDRSI